MINRSSASRYLCIVLAGYKSFLYPAVFSRLQKYALPEMDICIVSSGKYSKALDTLCHQHNWSYLWTTRNNVSLVQNAAILAHSHAQYIFKLDEDIFITEGYFEHMLTAYHHAQQGPYTPGVLAPLIPVNGYGSLRILEKLGLSDTFQKKFAATDAARNAAHPIVTNPDVAKFFWGEGGYVPSIDALNQRFWGAPLEERPCPIRFSIGAILFERTLWKEMGYFCVSPVRRGLGQDEVQICSYCLLNATPLMVSENIVVGHLSFGPQNEVMKAFYLANPDNFLPHDQ